jgi:preprotein translocase subunit YajC
MTELKKGMWVTTRSGLTAQVFKVFADGYVMLEKYGSFTKEDVRPATEAAVTKAKTVSLPRECTSD